MIEWNETHQQIRSMFRRFVETEIVPKREELEFGDLPPYGILRKMLQTFGADEMAKAQFQADIEREKAGHAPRRKKSARSFPKAPPMLRPCGLFPLLSLAVTVPG